MTLCEGSFCLKQAEFIVTLTTLSRDICDERMLCRGCCARLGFGVAPVEAFPRREQMEGKR